MIDEMASLLKAVDLGDFDPVALNHIPYYDFLALSVAGRDGRLITTMAYQTSLIGSPIPPRLHGGTLGALLEAAAVVELIADMHRDGDDGDRLPRPIGLTVDYLRPGGEKDTHARAFVMRRGRRSVSMRSLAWQDDEQKPLASALLHFLIG